MKKTTQYIVGGGLFAAIVAVLQLVGSAIRFGPFSISLVLIPIVLAAALYGWGMGCWLGLVFGAVVLLSGDAGLFLAANPAGAYLVVGMVGWNFLLETAVNMALTPMLAQLIRLGSRRCL